MAKSVWQTEDGCTFTTKKEAEAYEIELAKVEAQKNEELVEISEMLKTTTARLDRFINNYESETCQINAVLVDVNETLKELAKGHYGDLLEAFDYYSSY